MVELSELREPAIPELSFLEETFSITSGMTVTTQHALPRKPRMVWLALRCLVAELGYAIGDDVDFPAFTYTAGSTAASVSYNDTVVKVRLVALPVIVNFTTGATTAITAANWSLVIRSEV